MNRKDMVNYQDLIARTEAEESAEMDGELAQPLVDYGVDYSEEFRKQTGKDFATGEIVVQ